ncbi:MAG: class I SAM-dependent methyltransferase [Synergistaceae bacterium]|jgi:hypothetical protein|nr:class I SAM-dependent methyltransferase [Synergistaceae bacterium]
MGKLLEELHVKFSVLKELTKRKMFVPLEHYYSPIPAMSDIENHDFDFLPSSLPGVDLNDEEQLRLLDRFDSFYAELPFRSDKTEGLRYYFENSAYSYSDAIFYYCMLRYLKPRKLIEVGSGFSSCVALDTNEMFLNKQTAFTFIEPYPALFQSLLSGTRRQNIRLLESKLQNIPIDLFKELQNGDILFIDSTHVSKFGSDVNFVIHQILPALAEGVHIHFHDIFYPFEYPRGWLLEGRAWNEAYALRAFLEYNSKFKIVLFNTYLEKYYEEELRKRFPLIYKNTGGSLWLKKI